MVVTRLYELHKFNAIKLFDLGFFYKYNLIVVIHFV